MTTSNGRDGRMPGTELGGVVHGRGPGSGEMRQEDLEASLD